MKRERNCVYHEQQGTGWTCKIMDGRSGDTGSVSGVHLEMYIPWKSGSVLLKYSAVK